VYPCLPYSHTVYLVYPYISCVHVYPSSTVYSVYPYISCVPMLTLVSLYTLYTLVYSVYPCLPKSFCILAENSCQDHHIPYTYYELQFLVWNLCYLIGLSQSFLTNRTQALCIGNILSAWKHTHGDIPQGTKMGVPCSQFR